jgi:hypothetical protein
MNAKHVMVCLAAAVMLTPGSPRVIQAQEKQVATGHGGHGSVKGPLPEAVREATARFRDVSVAIAEGYALNGGCVSGPQAGAMGVHYAKSTLFDGTLEVENPEVLVYEPRGGRLELVAAEYVTPVAAWEGAGHLPGDQPQLMGHLLHLVPGPNRYGPDAFYELHVWAWKQNPGGHFADWNIRVSCADWPQ